jgi:adenylate cyclase
MAVRKKYPRLLTALAVGAGVALLIGTLQAAGFLDPLELKSYDLRMRWTAPDRKPVHPDIVLLMISDESIEWMKEKEGIGWPWDRRQFARLIQECSHEDFPATAILFDFFTFMDPDPYKGEPELIKALKGSSPVYVSVPFHQESVKRADQRADLEALLRRNAIEVVNDGSVQVVERRKSVLFPVPGVAEAVAGICDVETIEETDGITRRYQLFSAFRGRTYPSFVLAALMAREKTGKVEVRNRTIVVGRTVIPVERDGTIQLRYYGREGKDFPIITAPNVIGVDGSATTFDPSLVADKIIFIGTDASALFDLKVTPVAGTMAGVEIHAIALANVLNGEMMRSAPAAIPVLILAFFSLAVCGVTRFTGPATGGGAAIVIFAAQALLNVALFHARWVTDLVAPSAAIVLGYAVTSAFNHLYEGRQRRRVKREFQRYLSPRVVDKILKNPDALSMAGERKTLSIFFMDFAGFTAMSEKLDPTDLVKLISEYHHEAAEEIFLTEGTIDKYIGDAIMAFWNDPVDQPDHAHRACLSAVGVQLRLRALAARMKERGLPEMKARIGINTGIATVGNMGARGQVNYTLIGDEVNLASRICSVAKAGQVIIGDKTYQEVARHVQAEELPAAHGKGKAKPVKLWSVTAARPPERGDEDTGQDRDDEEWLRDSTSLPRGVD